MESPAGACSSTPAWAGTIRPASQIGRRSRPASDASSDSYAYGDLVPPPGDLVAVPGVLTLTDGEGVLTEGDGVGVGVVDCVGVDVDGDGVDVGDELCGVGRCDGVWLWPPPDGPTIFGG